MGAAAGCSDTAQQSATDGGLYQTAHRSAAATAESARRHAAGTAGAHPAAAHAQQYAATVDGPARNSRRYAEYSAAGAAAAPASTAGHGPARTGSTAWHDGWCQHEYWSTKSAATAAAAARFPAAPSSAALWTAPPPAPTGHGRIPSAATAARPIQRWRRSVHESQQFRTVRRAAADHAA